MAHTETSFSANQLVAGQASDSSVIKNSALLIMLLFIFLIPWGNVIWDGFTRIFGVIAFALALLVLVIHGTHRNYSFFHLLVLMFGSWLILSLLWSPDLASGKEKTTTIIQLVMISLLVSFLIDSKSKIRLAYQSYVMGAITASSIIFYNFINGIESNYYGRYGLANFEVDGVSIILALAIPMAAYLATQYKNVILKTINAVAIPLFILAIFFTATRTAAIAAIFGIAYWLYTHRKTSLSIKLLLVGFFISSIMVVLTFAPKASVDRIFTSGKSISAGTLNYRTVIWRASLEEWEKAPIIGRGIGSLANVLSSSHVEYGSAHNTFIQVLTENGIIGLTLYLLIIFSIIVTAFNVPENDRVFLLSLLLVALICQLTMNTLFDKESWFVLTMLAIHAYSMRKHSPS